MIGLILVGFIIFAAIMFARLTDPADFKSGVIKARATAGHAVLALTAFGFVMYFVMKIWP